MLNIHTRISLSKASKRRVRKYWKRVNGNLTADSWSAIHHTVKSELSEKLLHNQRYKCVYCERYLYGLGHEMDHFANKADNPRFSFNPVNIFYSCRFCNSPDRKGDTNIVLVPNNRYDQCLFDVLHPYCHDVDSHIFYQDADRVIFDWNRCTGYGRDTIIKLQFDDTIMTTIRSRDLIHQRLNPLTSDEEIELIQQSIAYVK